MKQPYRYALLIAAAMIFLTLQARATHIVGGEMTYTCLGNNQYEIKLTIFRDCFYGSPAAWFDDPASIGVFDASDNYMYQILVPLDPMLIDTLDPDLGSECFVVPPDVCVHTTTYTTTALLPFQAGGYQLVYQRCCRNQTIVNIVEPLDVGATYSINLTEEALLVCNSSPKFNNWPPLYLCVNQPFQIDQSATDGDGDSLVYALCNPLTGADPSEPMPQPPNSPPYDTVPWLGTYDAGDMLNGGAGGVAMTINSQTGLLTGTPIITGQFVIGICIEEYRDGQLISVSRRDYQVNVGNCGNITSSFFAPEMLCDSYTVAFDNQSVNASNYLWFFNYPDDLTATSTIEDPVYTYPDTGLYTIMLVAEPGVSCTDTFLQNIHILPNSLFAIFEVEQVDCADSLTVQVTDSSLDTAAAVASWDWLLVNGTDTLLSSEPDPAFVLTQQGTATLTLTVTSTNGCTRTLEQTFPVQFIDDPIFEDSISLCANGAGVELNPDGSFPGATYLWQPPNGLDDPNSPNPTAAPDSTTTYSVVITDSGEFCVVEKEVTVIVSPFATVTPEIDTLLEGESVQLTATYDPTYSYNWEPTAGLSDPNIHNPVATPVESTVYTLTVTDQNGCVVVRTVTLVVLTLCEEPFIFVPTGFSPNGDGHNDTFRVMGNNIEKIYLAVYNRWGEKVWETTTPGEGWDGTYKSKLLTSDAFGYYVELTCFGGLQFSKKGNVTLFR
jgi:gliding motility-associated-like protein